MTAGRLCAEIVAQKGLSRDTDWVLFEVIDDGAMGESSGSFQSVIQFAREMKLKSLSRKSHGQHVLFTCARPVIKMEINFHQISLCCSRFLQVFSQKANHNSNENATNQKVDERNNGCARALQSLYISLLCTTTT